MDIVEHLEHNASAWPDRPAYTDAAGTYTWADVNRRSGALAAALAARGIGPRDVVASLGHDRVETVETFYACARLGAVRTGINYRYAPREVRHLVNDANVKLIVIEAGECEQLLDAAGVTGRQRLRVGVGSGEPDSYAAAINRGAPAPPTYQGAPDDIVAISYTTGSTGLPKGALWKRAALPEVLGQTWSQTGIRNDDVFLHCLPAAGVPILLAVANVMNGHHVVLLERFGVEQALSSIERHRVTYLLLVPTMLHDLCRAASTSTKDLTSLRLLLYGSAPASPALIRAAMRVLNCELVQWYGSTEGTGGWYTQLTWRDHLAALAADDPREILMTCGRPFLHTRVELRRADGARAEAGEVGEVCVSSKTIMAGYHNLPGETAAALDGDWLRTGDLARWTPAGYLQLVDRRKFMIITGAYNVYPVVVENVLSEHPAVEEVCVVGVPDERWGEAVCAVIVPAHHPVDEEPLREGLLRYARERLAKFEVPKRIDFVRDLPRGATGKVLKRAVWNSYRAAPGAASTEP